MRRLFFALWPDDNTRQALQEISGALPLSFRQRIRAENWHITLAFIGNVDEALVPKIINVATAIKMPVISLVFDQLTYWQGASVLCLTCSQPDLAAENLVTQLSIPLTALGLTLDTRPYCPHVTLARHILNQPNVDFNPIIWTANQFALVESLNSSLGVLYRPIQYWQLASQPL